MAPSICITRMISDVECVFTCMLATCMSSSGKCVFVYYFRFLIRLFVFRYWNYTLCI